MKKPLNILSFLLIIFLGSSTLVSADFPPVKTGTILVCKNCDSCRKLPFTFLIEFINDSKTKTYNPRPIKTTKKGTYYMLGSTKRKYSSNNDSIVVKTRRLDSIGLWTLTIDRSNLEYKIEGSDYHSTLKLKCESVHKITFDIEIKKLKKEIEEHNNLLDEYYKETNKI